MCGIVGYVGFHQASNILLDGLKRLEYRGYDSSGLAVLDRGSIQLRRTVGKLSNLESALSKKPLQGAIGLGHTRWATHGLPSEENAHPHSDCSKKIVVVHNGIIENYSALKAELAKKGHQFVSQTDTEVIAHLIEEIWDSGRGMKPSMSPEDFFVESVRRSLLRLKGAYAVGILNAEFPEFFIAARKDCPLVIGIGEKENFAASDVPALLPHTRKIIFLDQEEMAVLKAGRVDCFNLHGEKIKKDVHTCTWNPVQAEKAGYKHFMLKEIMEQPTAVQDTLRGRILPGSGNLHLDVGLEDQQAGKYERIVLLACGTSYHAALVGKFWFESLSGIPCDVEIASEFRYRTTFLNAKCLAVLISQSGETADTLAALRIVIKSGAKSLAICNVLGATMTREADTTLYTHCGPEIGVASTKAFVAQLTALLLLAGHFAKVRCALSDSKLKEFTQNLVRVPGWIRETLALSDRIRAIGKKFSNRNHFLYLGRNLNYPIALEGALKLKEISYIHAEGYPAGEMKHGPIALIDRNMPILALATDSSVYEKILSNIEEAKARGGTVIAVGSEGNASLKEKVDEVIPVPRVPEIFSPIVNVVPLQLLAYHIAVERGCDVDQPRNLAKSVTVE